MAGFDRETKVLCWQRDNGACFRCGSAVWEGDVHHRLARKAGGANARLSWINALENLLLLCRGCHNFIEDHPRLARAAGWMISGHQDPQDVLVWSWDGLWYRLHGQDYKTPVAGILAPFEGSPPPLWSALAA